MVAADYVINPLPANSFLGSELRDVIDKLQATELASRRSTRPLEYFGAVADDFGAVPSSARQAANDTAILDAREWMQAEGGCAVMGGGQYGFLDPVDPESYFNMIGIGARHSWAFWPTRQACFKTATGALSPAFIRLRDFRITNNAWQHFQSEADAIAFAAIDFDGSNTGPQDALALAREGRQALFDPYHEVNGVHVVKFDGTAVRMKGRGENRLVHMVVSDVSGEGFDVEAPDNWFLFNTISGTGSSGWRAQTSNVRSVGNKLWFCGKNGFEEVVGAGIELDGAGQGNFNSACDSIQDTWGPGIVLDGDHPQFVGLNLSECGGGRVSGQGDGFQGTRTLSRTNIRVGTCRRAVVQGTVDATDRDGAANRASLVDFATSGARQININLSSEEGLFSSTLVEAASGYTSAGRHSEVWFNNELVAGRVSAARLNDPTDGINEAGYIPSVVLMDDGRFGQRIGNDWIPTTSGAAITP